ncbi:hypothetical protein P3X46_016327 [Hevea brasiliensis]|uniref:Protein kinase domain-containing protein n=1 Tax=Hevea brasiliensis TaxID=3981 RepID=A0ABQ9M045_HEVBR|nr:receptor-like protein kinase FERONIA [Hevea brasiliensis]KAJ9173163.1 hypothetical protein P3X46_016327 [Hevea brasiliensis]
MSLGDHPSLYLVLLLHLLPSVTGIKNSLPYTPIDLILLDCGESSISTSLDGRTWDGDADSKFHASNPEAASSAFTASQQDPSVTQVPYMTARIFQSQFTYTFPVSPGPKFVRLYFYPATYSNLDISKSCFSLSANTYTLLNNFSAFLTVSAMKPSVASFIKEYIITVWDNQKLDLTFSPSPSSFAFINGIEIVSMPNNLYASGNNNPLPYVGIDSHPFYLDNTTALEKLYRLNVGGQDISGKDDTGMHRTWLQDLNYIVSGAVAFAIVPPDVKIQYTMKTPAYTAPVMVYGSMRFMGPDSHLNLNYNLTWYFSIDAGFNYLVRLHFCEFRPEVTRSDQVVFYIFINNQTAEAYADIILWSGGNRVPLYKDYVLWIPKGSHSKQYLCLALHPNFDIKRTYADAFLNGLEIFKLNNSGGSLASPGPELLAGSPPPENLPKLNGKTNEKRFLVVIVVGSVFGGMLALSLVICFFVFKKRRVKDFGKSEAKSMPSTQIVSSLPSDRCCRFTIVEMKAATKNFDDENFIGSGGFGNVYKGYIGCGSIPVAIKRLDSSSKQGIHEFKTEIEMLSQLRHVNLVSLIGYCIDEGEMILVYDYMINGTLREHLYESNNNPLPWKKRLHICIGAARGLHYLHAEVANTIIHRDVKTSNILLDEKWVAKVSDFGLSKIAYNEAVSTIVKGTWGYLDPEYARYQQLTEKSDVYSFGVVLLEVLCARKPLNQKLEEEQMNLVNWAQKCIQNGTLCQIIDPHLKGRIAPECSSKFVEIALSCLSDKGIERPTMHDVMGKLEFVLELQEAADAEKVMNPDIECVYPEASFFDSPSANIIGEPQFDSSAANGSISFDTSIIGTTESMPLTTTPEIGKMKNTST